MMYAFKCAYAADDCQHDAAHPRAAELLSLHDVLPTAHSVARAVLHALPAEALLAPTATCCLC